MEKLGFFRSKILITLLFLLCSIFTVFFIDVFVNNGDGLDAVNSNLLLDYSDWDKRTDDKTVILSTTFDESMVGETLSFYSRNANVILYDDDEVVYYYGDTSWFSKTSGVKWQFMDLSSFDVGDNLSLKITYNIPMEYDSNPEIYIGNVYDIVLDILSQNIFILMCDILFVIIGTIMLSVFVFSYSAHGMRYQNLLFLSQIAYFVAFWSLNSTILPIFAYPSGICQYYMYYILLQIIGTVILLYIKSLCDIQDFKALYLYLPMCMVLNILQMTHIVSYSDTLMFFFVYMFSCMFYELYIFVRNQNKKRSISYVYGFVLMFVCFGIDMFIYFSKRTGLPVIRYTLVGFLIYFFIVLLNLIIEVVNSYHNHKEMEKAMTIAFTDSLTGLKNRTAFSKDVEDLELNDIAFVSLDLNNLKFYNDTKGHHIGDLLIKTAAEILRESFTSNDIYRTGGDEFIVIYDNSNGDAFEIYRNDRVKLKHACEEKSNDELILEIASGFAEYKPSSDKTYEDIFKRADDFMLKNKATIKAHSKLDKGAYVDNRISI